jgi:hypothetical protein
MNNSPPSVADAPEALNGAANVRQGDADGIPLGVAHVDRTRLQEELDAGVPLAEARGAVPEMRRRLALAAREELERRKRRLAVMTYDDLLTRLDATLDRSPEAAERLRARHAVVLVDEFQDTDPVQWDILRRAFGEGDATLVLIGDPRQAIYAFRGADVYAYLAAARAAATTRAGGGSARPRAMVPPIVPPRSAGRSKA